MIALLRQCITGRAAKLVGQLAPQRKRAEIGLCMVKPRRGIQVRTHHTNRAHLTGRG